MDNNLQAKAIPNDDRLYRVVLAGNPNAGKTTLFNKLTGLRYKVGNYPGVTVEKKAAKLLLDNKKISLIDLPGIYSLGSFSEDEQIATESLFGTLDDDPLPDLIIAVADASNLERNLFFISQLIDLQIPLVLVLTMLDLAEKNGIKVQSELLSRELGVPVISVRTAEGKGLNELKRAVVKTLVEKNQPTKKLLWCQDKNFIESARLVGKKYRELKPYLSPKLDTSIGMSLLSNAIDSSDESTLNTINEQKLLVKQAGQDPESFEASSRYLCVNQICRRTIQKTKEKSYISQLVDSILVHKISGLICFMLIMSLIFQGIFAWAEAPMHLIELVIAWLSSNLTNLLPPGLLKSLVIDGIIAGVGNVVIFIPQITILFFLLGMLEDSGYLSRAAFVMDRVMRPVGLQGRSFIPLLSSFACAIPGIMATRTIASKSDRLATILVAPLMSCSARLPVYALLIAAFIPQEKSFFGFSFQALTLLSMYLLGIVFAALVSFLLKKTILRSEPSLFLMEMPPLRFPSFLTVLRDVYDRVRTFVKSAGTIILACSIVMWSLASFPRDQETGEAVNVNQSYAAKIGKSIEPVIRPLGFSWEIGVGIIASFAAREVFVSTLATIYNLDSEEDSPSLIRELKIKAKTNQFSTASALSLMVFYVFACQCMSTLAVCKRETGSWAWVSLMFGYMTILAYSMSYITYQILKDILI